jgi:hypothetical protein
VTRELIRYLLEMDSHGRGHEHAWPGQISDQDAPGIDDWLADAEDSLPGCLITWYENDAINACFDEEAQHMGENGPCQPNVAIPIRLDKPNKELDEEVRRAFEHAGAMLRSLACAARIIEIVRDLTGGQGCADPIQVTGDLRNRILHQFGRGLIIGQEHMRPVTSLFPNLIGGQSHVMPNWPSRTIHFPVPPGKSAPCTRHHCTIYDLRRSGTHDKMLNVRSGPDGGIDLRRNSTLRNCFSRQRE